MERILKRVLSTVGSVILVFAVLFGICWHSDGFAAAWGAFFGSDSLSKILGFLGAFDWLIGIALALIAAAVAEALIGRKLKKRIIGLIVDAAAAIVSFFSFIFTFK